MPFDAITHGRPGSGLSRTLIVSVKNKRKEEILDYRPYLSPCL
jgi:hypothetical protein